MVVVVLLFVVALLVARRAAAAHIVGDQLHVAVAHGRPADASASGRY